MRSSLRRLTAGLAAATLLAASAVAPAAACTGILLTAADGSVIHARTLEFGIDLQSEILVIPRGLTRTGETPDGKPGLTWTSKYASTGMNAVGKPILVDGLNERGLAIGLFYFPGSATYMPYTPADAPRTLAAWQLGSYILENFATVAEARAGLENVVVPAVVLQEWKFAPEVHFVVRDASGQSIVIEPLEGKLRVFEAPLGVITNSPRYDWHTTNLRNYVNFSAINAPPVQLGAVKLTGFGQGTGMLGLPGDFTPPSRFVRAVAFSQTLLPSLMPTGRDAVLQAYHLLNNFDIPKGVAREAERDEHGNITADYTLWTSAADLKARRYHVRTYENSQIRSIDLLAQPLDAKEIRRIPLTGQEVIRPLP